MSQADDVAPLDCLSGEGVVSATFSGKHPKELVGTQIAQIAPINKGEVVWTVNAVDLPVIGRAVLNGQYAPEYKVAVTGSKVTNSGYATMLQGVNLAALIRQSILISITLV